MAIRPIDADDEDALKQFVRDIPAEDRNFFKEDVTDPNVVRRWLLHDGPDIRLVSTDADGSIVAVGTVAPGIGRCRHVGDLRVVVAAQARRRGAGRRLAQQALIDAVAGGITRITVEVAATQQGPIEMFRDLGFQPEALLRGQLRDADGTLHDVVVLAHSVGENWASMQAAGLEELAG